MNYWDRLLDYREMDWQERQYSLDSSKPRDMIPLIGIDPGILSIHYQSTRTFLPWFVGPTESGTNISPRASTAYFGHTISVKQIRLLGMRKWIVSHLYLYYLSNFTIWSKSNTNYWRMCEIEYFKSRKAKNRPIFSLNPNGNKHDKQQVNTALYCTICYNKGTGSFWFSWKQFQNTGRILVDRFHYVNNLIP